MTKKLTVLMCALILTGFGALASAEPASSGPSAQPGQAAVETAVETAAFMSQDAFLQTLNGTQVPAPIAMTGCQGGLYGSCDNNMDCKGYFCPLGEIRYCFGGTGSGCQGSCGCW